MAYYYNQQPNWSNAQLRGIAMQQQGAFADQGPFVNGPSANIVSTVAVPFVQPDGTIGYRYAVTTKRNVNNSYRLALGLLAVALFIVSLYEVHLASQQRRQPDYISSPGLQSIANGLFGAAAFTFVVSLALVCMLILDFTK
jgi:hypothetical protein